MRLWNCQWGRFWCKQGVFVFGIDIKMALVEGKDPAVTSRTIQSRAMPMRFIHFSVLCLFLGLGVSAFSLYTIRYFKYQNVAPVAQSKITPCFHDTGNIESWIRPPSTLMHTMNDTELFWRASFVTRIKNYPFKRVPKIAFMFLTKGPLPMAPLWERFFEGHKGLYSIYIHSMPSYIADFPPSSVFYKRQIPSQVC